METSRYIILPAKTVAEIARVAARRDIGYFSAVPLVLEAGLKQLNKGRKQIVEEKPPETVKVRKSVKKRRSPQTEHDPASVTHLSDVTEPKAPAPAMPPAPKPAESPPPRPRPLVKRGEAGMRVLTDPAPEARGGEIQLPHTDTSSHVPLQAQSGCVCRCGTVFYVTTQRYEELREVKIRTGQKPLCEDCRKSADLARAS